MCSRNLETIFTRARSILCTLNCYRKGATGQPPSSLLGDRKFLITIKPGVFPTLYLPFPTSLARTLDNSSPAGNHPAASAVIKHQRWRSRQSNGEYRAEAVADP